MWVGTWGMELVTSRADCCKAWWLASPANAHLHSCRCHCQVGTLSEAPTKSRAHASTMFLSHKNGELNKHYFLYQVPRLGYFCHSNKNRLFLNLWLFLLSEVSLHIWHLVLWLGVLTFSSALNQGGDSSPGPLTKMSRDRCEKARG